MRILIDSRLYGLENAGIGRYLINLTKELKKQGTKEHFVILLREKYYKSLSFPKNWKKVLADFGPYGFAEQLLLPFYLAREKPDLVHFPHFNIPIFWRGKFVVTIHDMTMHRQRRDASKLPPPVYLLKRIPYKVVFRLAVKRAKKIIVPSRAVKNELVDYFSIEKEKVEVIYEGIDLPSFSSRNEKTILDKHDLSSGKYFFYVGNAYPHKNLKRAIEAVVQLNESSKEKTLFVIASSKNTFTKRLKKFTKDVGGREFIKFIGFVPDEELVVLYKNSVALMYPSLSEGFGLQGLEAMKAGTLVLASNIPVFKEIYKNNAFFFNPLDVSSIQKTMEEVIKMGDKKRDQVIRGGQKFIKRYSWTKMARETLKVYNEVLGG